MNTCPLCHMGKLFDKIDIAHVDYLGSSKELKNYFSVCDVCGVTQISPEQHRLNKQIMVEFKDSVRETNKTDIPLFRIPHERYVSFLKEYESSPRTQRLGQAFYDYMSMQRMTQDKSFCDRLYTVDDCEARAMIVSILDYPR